MGNRIRTLVFSLFAVGALGAQQGTAPGAATGAPGSDPVSFAGATETLQQQLAASLAELERLNQEIAAAKLPLGRQLNDLETERSSVRAQFQQATKDLGGRALDLDNLRQEAKWRGEQNDYLSTTTGEYVRNFESRLHIAELDRYRAPLQAAKLAAENSSLEPQQAYAAQLVVLATALGRLETALGGETFDGSAVDPNGFLSRGTFVLVGPVALFRSADGTHVGTAEQRLGSLEPAAIAFATPEIAAAANKVVGNGAGMFPLDPTLGNAHKIEATRETLFEHIKAGGTVMIPIFVLAGISLLIATYKWLRLMTQRKPSRSSVTELLGAVRDGDYEAARDRAETIRGPAGRMLEVGVEHVREPRELIEEVMYENVLTTRLRLQSMLPFIAISAAAAPLLGLLGTVTGIMETFKMITVFGTGDVKTLSGGISVALITTEYGLIVAIPSLLLHSLLSRKARGVIDEMEKTAIAFVNEVAKSRSEPIGQVG